MVQRCTNPKTKDFHRYGGRGIDVCERWLSFENFLADMGQRPTDQHSIERIDNSKGYSPENCKWALRHDQNRNRRSNIKVTWRGETKIISDWADDLGISRASIYWRYQNGHRGDQLFRTQDH